MKKSIYSSLINISNEKSMLYNAFSDKFLNISKHLREIWLDKSVEEIKEIEPFFYNRLVDSKFIIISNCDEQFNLITAFNALKNKTDEFTITINPTLDCNFKCWYCYETHIKDSYIDQNTLEIIKKYIYNVLNNNELKKFTLAFFGGEPLLQFQNTVKPLIAYAYDLCKELDIKFNVGFTTNGYLINDKMIEFFKSFPDCGFSFQITIDGNEESHNKTRFPSTRTPSYKQILNNIEKLIENGYLVILRINFTNRNIHGIKDLIPDLSKPIFKICTEKETFHLDFHKVWQDKLKQNNENDMEIDEIISLFRCAGLRASYLSNSKIKNICYAEERNYVLINYNLDVHKCTAVDFSKKSRFGYLNDHGEVVWDEYKLSLWMKSTLRKNCLSCRIAPLCGGGCPNTNHGEEEFCLNNYDENKKDKLVLSRFENQYIYFKDPELTSQI